TKNILATNDSPDLGFRWSVNPYRGCMHACAYCVSGETRVLAGDGRPRRLADLRPGDEIYGTRLEGPYRRYVRTQVLPPWQVVKPAFRVTLEDGTELISSGDHRFLSTRGWKHVVRAEPGLRQRPHLTLRSLLPGTGGFARGPDLTDGYRRGYLCGIIRGDGLLDTYRYDGRRRARDVQHQFRLALIDLEALRRAKTYLADARIETTEFAFSAAHGDRAAMTGIRTHAQSQVRAIRELVAWPEEPGV